MAFDQFYQVDATNQMIEVPLRSSSTGQLLTGVAYGDLTATYIREGASSETNVSPVTMTQGTYVSGGWTETGIAGVYQFGIPNAALAAGAKAVTLVFSASGAIDVVKRVVLVVEDLRDVLVSSRPTAAEMIAAMDADPPAVNVTDLLGTALTETGAGYLAAALVKLLDVAVPVFTAASANQTGDAFARLGAPAGASVSADIAALPTDGDVQAAAVAALTAYDPPTKAELDAAVAPLALEATVGALPTAAAIADQVWDEAIVDHDGAGSTGATLNTAASASGAGSTAYTNTVTDSSSNPLDGVEVWITSDSGGVSTVASTTTDTLGAFTVYLDPGTYYLWLAKGGYNFGNPTEITVS